MKSFNKVLYEGTLVAVGKVLAKYNAFAQGVMLREIGQDIVAYLRRHDRWIEETGTLEDLEKVVNLFLEEGFAQRLEVTPADHGHFYTWHDLQLLDAYKDLQDITGSPFISCPLNLCLTHVCNQHGKVFKLHRKTFDMDRRVTVSQWELMEDATEAEDGSFDPMVIENARLFELAEERANRLEAAHRELAHYAQALEKAKLEAEEQAARLREQARELVAARELALHSAKAKSEFLASMSHEIRTPMNGVIALAELLRRTPLNEEQRDYVGTVTESGEALLAIINDILDLSKIEAGQMALEISTFSPETLVREAVELLTPLAREKRLVLSAELAPNLPAAVRGDPVRLRQVLVNLLGNALKFTIEGQVVVRVEVRELHEGQAVLGFAVEDTGVGITAEQQKFLFDPFYQAGGGVPRRSGGTGLGLTISRRLVAAMGGELSVRSAPGEGSCFGFALSFERTHRDAVDRIPESAVGSHLGRRGTPPSWPTPTTAASILVVEDDHLNQRIARQVLEKLGHHVSIAGSGAEALQVLADSAFDLVLMDCQMPEMDGYELTREIRRRERDSAGPPQVIIAMTASAFESDRKRCLAAGMNDFVSKPVKPHQLSTLVERWRPAAESGPCLDPLGGSER